MPTQVTSLLGRFTHALREFTVAQRTLAIIGVIGLVIAAVALGAWLTRPSYAPLFSGLSGPDASAIVEQLQGAGVPYELADGGTTVLVPQEQVDAQRLAAAAEGLPGDTTVGYSLLDGLGVTSSEFQQTVTYKRALEGELATTIEAMEGVRTASVRLAIPEESVFVAEKQDPTASVFIETAPGATLDDEQVAAITHLTSASVDGMKPIDVAVIDADGRTLSAVGEKVGGSDETGADYEARVTDNVQAMLDKVVGPGNATVVVTADVSPESAQRVSETFTQPAAGAPTLSESSTVETYGAGVAGQTAAGVLGPDNIAVPNGDAAAGGDDAYYSGSGQKVNGVDKVTETRDIPAGAIVKQSVSVAVDSAVDGVTVAALQQMVSTAAGIDPARGDLVAVQLVPFAAVAEGEAGAALAEREAAQGQESLTQIITTGIIALAAIVGLVILLAVIARLTRRRADERAVALDAVDSVELGSVAVAPAAVAAAAAASPLTGSVPPPILEPGAPAPGFTPAEPLPIAEASNIDRVRASVEALAGADPARTADYLRSLMDDRPSS
jgi:flagellar M-ring protein FliF